MDLNQFRQISVPLCAASKSFNKVFGIGANKTGTTSLQAIFHILGLNVAPQQDGELCGVQAYNGNLRPLSDYINKYDAFQDAPFSIKSTYAQVDALFPGSKFILTYRDADTWFESLLRFHKKILGVPVDQPITRERAATFPYLYPGYIPLLTRIDWLQDVDGETGLKTDWNLLYDAEHYKNLYRARNQEILRHFSERGGDLLVIDITKEKDTRKIVEFLGLPEQLITDIPHLNAS
jgi:Sulfotransferase domain